MLDAHVMVGDGDDNEAVLLVLSDIFHGAATLSGLAREDKELLLNHSECAHGVLESELVLIHLRENSADVEVDVSGVRDLEGELVVLI